jgi:hypothetical protein
MVWIFLAYHRAEAWPWASENFAEADRPSHNYIPVKFIAKQWLANIWRSGGSVQNPPFN